MELSVPSDNYETEQHYTGWHPILGSQYGANFVGNGIAVIDKKKVVQGTFGTITNFPNEGQDYYNPKEIFEYVVYDLENQDRPAFTVEGKKFVATD